MGESDDKDVDISSTTPCQADPCYDSDGNYNEVLTRFVNGEFPDYDYYEKGALFKIPKKGRRKTTTPQQLKTDALFGTIRLLQQVAHKV